MSSGSWDRCRVLHPYEWMCVPTRGVIQVYQLTSTGHEFQTHLEFLRPLESLFAHGALKLALALVIVVDVTPESPCIWGHLSAYMAAMLAGTLYVYALHVLLQAGHAL